MTRFLLVLAILPLLGSCSAGPARRGPDRETDFDAATRTRSARTASSPRSNDPDAGRVVRGVVDRTNAFRREQGRRPVERERQLTSAAQYFADYMARTGEYGHTADGKQPADRATAHGYTYCVVLENIAYMYSSAGFETRELADGLFTGWRESPGHRTNMLDRDVQHTGVAVARAEDGTWYAVQMFGRPASAKLIFKLVNGGDRPVRYEVGGERFTLEPHWTRTHTQCRPEPVVFGGGGNAQAGGVRPANGAAYEVTAEPSGKVRVKHLTGKD